MSEAKTGITRRSFLKSTALVVGAAAMTGVTGCSTIAEQSAEQVHLAGEEQTFTNWCRGNCGGPCNLTGTVREGKLVKTSPTVLPHDKSYFRLGCVRSHSGPQRVYGQNRVLYPMKQTGERGSDDWERISWDEALSLIGEKFTAAEKEYGRESVVVSIGAGNSVGLINGYYARYANYEPMLPSIGVRMFLKKTGYTETFYSSDCASLWMTQFVMPSPQHSVEDVKNSKAIFMWGINLPESGTSGWQFVLDAHRNGAKLICIDPQYSKAAAQSDIWVPIRPGTDAALLLAMCNYMIDNGHLDEDYLSNGSVAPLLIDEEGKYLRLSDLGKSPVEVTNATTGESVPTDTEVVYDPSTGEFGSSFEVKNPAISGTYQVAGKTVRTVYDVVVENIKGYTLDWAADECGLDKDLIEELCKIYAENHPVKSLVWCGWEHLANTWRNYFAINFLASLTGNAVCAGGGYNYGYTMGNSIMKPAVKIDDSAVSRVTDPKENVSWTLEYLPQIIESGKWNGKDFPVRCLFVVAENILGSQMGPTYMKQAFDKIDFIVVADPINTYTTKYADLVLPVSLSWEDIDYNNTFMMQKAVEPLGEARSTFEILKGVAEAVGYTDLYTKSQEDYLKEALNTPENIAAGVSFDDFMEKGVVFSDGVEGSTSASLAGWDQGDPEDLPETLAVEFNSTGRTQFYVEVLNPTNEIGQEFGLTDRMPYYEHAYESYKDNPLKEKYPYHGLNGFHNHYFGQTFLGDIPWLDELRGFEGEPYARIHPKVASEKGLKTGDTVRIYNDHGYVVCKVVVSSGLREDVIATPHGYSHDQYIDGDPQDLVPMAIDPVCCNNNFNDYLCQIEKA